MNNPLFQLPKGLTRQTPHSLTFSLDISINRHLSLFEIDIEIAHYFFHLNTLY